MAVTMISNKIPTLIRASTLFNKMPPLLENACIKQANVAVAMAIPRTVPAEKLSDARPGWAAWRTLTAKLMAFPAMFPTQMRLMPQTHATKSTVFFLYLGFRNTYWSLAELCQHRLVHVSSGEHRNSHNSSRLRFEA